MKHLFAILLVAFFSFQSNAQVLVLDSIIGLPNEIVESSGLIFFNRKLITHTDSGGENALYEIDTSTAQILRKVYVSNAVNKDWEDITQDENHIYIADFGNNAGNRTDLKILKINKADFLSMDSVLASFIYFSYEDQVDFTASNQNTNFDAEAIVSFEDSLYVFSKNWGNEETNLYQIPKDTGIFSAKKIANYNIHGMVTGAVYNDSNQSIFLIGYRTFGLPFAATLSEFNGNEFFNGVVNRYNVQIDGSVQIEAICNSSSNKYFVSSENFLTLKSSLHTFNAENSIIQSIERNFSTNRYVAIPNPTNYKVQINKHFDYAVLYNKEGKHINVFYEKTIDLSMQINGLYYLKLFNADKQTQVMKILKQ